MNNQEEFLIKAALIDDMIGTKKIPTSNDIFKRIYKRLVSILCIALYKRLF